MQELPQPSLPLSPSPCKMVAARHLALAFGVPAGLYVTVVRLGGCWSQGWAQLTAPCPPSPTAPALM